MPSYVITGVSRGIGAAFLKKLSSDPSNTIIGLVRNVAETEKSIASWKTPNIHILEGDVNKYDTLKKAAEATSTILSGRLDYILANAAAQPMWTAFDPFSVLGRDPERLTRDLHDTFSTNAIGNIHLFNLFIPLILKGSAKKVITITTGMADHDLTVKYGVYEGAPYAVSKAAMNMVTSKFQAEYEKDGVLFMGICPGVVDTGLYNELSEEEKQKLGTMSGKFAAYAPHFKAPATPEDAVKDVLKVVEKSSLTNGAGGTYLSHLGNKQWL